MAWQPGQSGNPEGAKKERRFYAALNRAILADDGQRVRSAAEKLLDLAAAGEQWAIKELRDTLDGKPAQSLTLAGDADNPLQAVTRVELVALNADSKG